MLQMMPPLLSLSLLVSTSFPNATALTDAMSESVLFFFCSDFRKEIFVDLNCKRFLAAVRSEPSTFRSNKWWIRPQDHSVLLEWSIFHWMFSNFQFLKCHENVNKRVAVLLQNIRKSENHLRKLIINYRGGGCFNFDWLKEYSLITSCDEGKG